MAAASRKGFALGCDLAHAAPRVADRLADLADLGQCLLDHALRSHLGLPRFVRYCDDLPIFHEDAGRLREGLVQVEQVAERLRLRLAPARSSRADARSFPQRGGVGCDEP